MFILCMFESDLQKEITSNPSFFLGNMLCLEYSVLDFKTFLAYVINQWFIVIIIIIIIILTYWNYLSTYSNWFMFCIAEKVSI